MVIWDWNASQCSVPAFWDPELKTQLSCAYISDTLELKDFLKMSIILSLIEN